MAQLSEFDETRFKRQVDAALTRVRTILDTTRQPQYAEDVQHKYDDKYMLAEFMTNAALAAQLNTLELLGLNAKSLQELKEWSDSRSVTLRFASEETCTFDRMVEKEVEPTTKHVTEVKGSWVGNYSRTDKVITIVKEYYWIFKVSYELYAFKGNDPATKVHFQKRSATYEIMTKTDVTPRVKSTVMHEDCYVNWVFALLSKEFGLSFAIDRSVDSCHTPRRNKEIEKALSHFRGWFDWASKVQRYFQNVIFPIQENHGLDLGKMNDSGIFVPLAPLFEAPGARKEIEAPKDEKILAGLTPNKSEFVIPVGDINYFLLEQKRSMVERLGEMEKMFPDEKKGKLITFHEAKLICLFLHSKQIAQQWYDGVGYLEQMLRNQIIAAIGKEVQPKDFYEYMIFHNRRLFKPEFEPKPFCFAVRRPDHYPEGVVSVNMVAEQTEPIQTMVNVVPTTPMVFPINAATNIGFLGNRYLHGWVAHEFGGHGVGRLQLEARVRQFSSFIVVCGTVASERVFQPKEAIIVTNKDTFINNLTLEQIPTPKEFRDAIESLSPEQQRFAKSYREMQLASTLFGILVIQIKPQLEKLLKIPDDSLTKHIQLTQDLMELFITYQIPSDLLSFDGDEKAPVTEKINTVKSYVQRIQEMIATVKKEELANAADKYEMNTLSYAASPRAPSRGGPPPPFQSRSSGPPPPPGGGGPPPSPMAMNAPCPPPAGGPPPSASPAAPAPEAPKQDAPVDAPKQEFSLAAGGYSQGFDFTKLPGKLDKSFRKLDLDNSLHSTIIKSSGSYSLTRQKTLLSEAAPVTVEIKKEKEKAFDLLDAITRSGTMPLEAADFHVVLASTHCFTNNLINTLVMDNVNPIEKVERSMLIVGTTIHDKPASELVNEQQVERVKTYSSGLFLKDK